MDAFMKAMIWKIVSQGKQCLSSIIAKEQGLPNQRVCRWLPHLTLKSFRLFTFILQYFTKPRSSNFLKQSIYVFSRDFPRGKVCLMLLILDFNMFYYIIYILCQKHQPLRPLMLPSTFVRTSTLIPLRSSRKSSTSLTTTEAATSPPRSSSTPSALSTLSPKLARFLPLSTTPVTLEILTSMLSSTSLALEVIQPVRPPSRPFLRTSISPRPVPSALRSSRRWPQAWENTSQALRSTRSSSTPIRTETVSLASRSSCTLLPLSTPKYDRRISSFLIQHFLISFTASAYVIKLFLYLQYLNMDQEKCGELKARFLHAISNDSPTTRLWKFRVFIQIYPDVALDLKEKMLEYALKNRLLGEFQTIYGLFGVTLINIPRVGAYDVLKTEMQTTVNKLKIEASQLEQVGKVEEELKIYLKLGEIYSKYGDHKESEYYYARILRKQSTATIIKDEEYLWHWGREMFYLVDSLEDKGEYQVKSYQDLQFFSVRVFPDKKSINSTLAFIRDIYKLSRKGRARSKVKVLENILEGNFSIQDLLAAKIFNMADLGFLYTILALAFKDRKFLKKDVKWSSKIEISYLNADYAKLFLDLRKAYDHYGQFNVPIRLMFDQCLIEIKNRVFCEIFNAYQIIPAAKVESMTGIRSIEIENWVRQNSDLPYLWDPITQSIVYYEKTVPLYVEAMTFYRLIKEKYEEKERMLSNETREDMDVESVLRMMGREGILGRDSGMKRGHFH